MKEKKSVKKLNYKYIIIVESPAKAKTIKKYLGKNYEVVASMGHIRDLPKSKLGIDIENNFEPNYINIKGKAPLINDLKKRSKSCEKVFLAADPDREGEAISFHIANILGLSKDEENRITFNEITKDAVKYGVKNPRKIDMNLFDAQQARRILDRLVGYKLSPFLWMKVKKGLSAGRVQSVAVKIIVDREEEIRNFVSKEYWTIDAHILDDNKKEFISTLSLYKGKKIEIENEEQANKILNDINDLDFKIEDIKKSLKKRTPYPPFITSTLQQDASRKFNFQSKKTMKIAQELYEGIEIKGMGTQGLITYMRTDSFRLSPQSLDEARSYILNKYGDEYCPSSPRYYKSKQKKDNIQDAHEAIRPTIINLHPDEIKTNLTNDQYKLYKLIWERFISCQMQDCILDTVSVKIKAGDYLFKSTGSTVKFKGFTALYEESKDEKDKKLPILPNLTNDTKLTLKMIDKIQHFTQPAPRYTEASLIKTLEENGIGRPSTYSPTISTILSRGYIERQGKSLCPTELGEVTTKLMIEHFSSIVDEEFSAQMEENLDKIEAGIENWKDIINKFYNDFEKSLNIAEKQMEGTKIELTPIVSDVICENCGKNMIVKTGRFGEFLACPSYPECKNTKPIVKPIEANCPICESEVYLKKSKKGKTYYGCSNNPKCSFMSWDEPLKELCPQCSAYLLKKIGRFGKIYCSNEKCDYKRGLKD